MASSTGPARRTRKHYLPKPGPPTVELDRVGKSEPEMLRHRAMLETVAATAFDYPEARFTGRGIVICGGGARYFPSVYVTVRLLRHVGCRLPIEVWHLGPSEMSPAMRQLLAPFDVECVDAFQVRRVHPARQLSGWELKCYAVMHSRFAELLLLDADNCAVRDPAFLFETAEYHSTGAIFWPDFWAFPRTQAVWRAAGILYRDEPQFESGQMVIDKRRCWHALAVAMHLNDFSDWWYRVVHGDKDTFHVAWRKLGQDYAMPPHPVRAIEATMLQHDFQGRLLFQHRNFAKWKLYDNPRLPGFRWESKCLEFVAELRARWNELPAGVRRYAPEGKSPRERLLARRLTVIPWDYHRVGYGRRRLTFQPDGRIGEGAADCELLWDVQAVKGVSRLEVFGADQRTFTAWPDGRGGWRGQWECHEGMPIELLPCRTS